MSSPFSVFSTFLWKGFTLFCFCEFVVTRTAKRTPQRSWGRSFDSRTGKKEQTPKGVPLYATCPASRWGFAPWESPTASKLLIRSFDPSSVGVGLSIPVRAKKEQTPFGVCSFFGDPYGNRTHVTAVKGRCLNRLTNGPGSGDLIRTGDIPGMNRVLYQLSYAAI